MSRKESKSMKDLNNRKKKCDTQISQSLPTEKSDITESPYVRIFFVHRPPPPPLRLLNQNLLSCHLIPVSTRRGPGPLSLPQNETEGEKENL